MGTGSPSTSRGTQNSSSESIPWVKNHRSPGGNRRCCTCAYFTAHGGFVSDWVEDTPLHQPVVEGTALFRLTLGKHFPLNSLSSLIYKLDMIADPPLEVNTGMKGIKDLAQSLFVFGLSPPTCLLKSHRTPPEVGRVGKLKPGEVRWGSQVPWGIASRLLVSPTPPVSQKTTLEPADKLEHLPG